MAFLQSLWLLGDFLRKSLLGVTLALGRRMKRIPELLAESISRSASLVARKLHSILLHNLHRSTSPSSTSLKVRLSLPDLTTRVPSKTTSLHWLLAGLTTSPCRLHDLPSSVTRSSGLRWNLEQTIPRRGWVCLFAGSSHPRKYWAWISLHELRHSQ